MKGNFSTTHNPFRAKTREGGGRDETGRGGPTDVEGPSRFGVGFKAAGVRTWSRTSSDEIIDKRTGLKGDRAPEETGHLV